MSGPDGLGSVGLRGGTLRCIIRNLMVLESIRNEQGVARAARQSDIHP